ncbi:MAG: hypothetical protein ACRDFS_12300 [Chloroflexota bacterium]
MAAAGAALVIAVALFLGLRSGGAVQNADAAALSYARRYMVWSAGPKVVSSEVVPLAHLGRTLSGVQPSVRQDLNAASIIKRYGAKRRVAQVILKGTYNSLPPDEGVEISGEVVVIVTVPDDRVLTLAD